MGVLLISGTGTSLPTPVEPTLINVDEVLRQVVGWLGSVICLTVAAKAQHKLEAGPRAYVAYNFVDDIHVVGIVVGFLAVFFGPYLRSCLLFRRPFRFVSMARYVDFHISWWMKTVFSKPSCRTRSKVLFISTTL